MNDELRIGSGVMKKMIATLIRKILKKKLGVDPVIKFNDELTVRGSGQAITLHLNCDISVSDQELSQIIQLL